VRLQERLDDPTKNWKFSAGDIEVRKQWGVYQRGYSEAIAATGTPWAPWTIVPANSKTHRNLMIGTIVRDALKNLGLRYPPGDPALAKVRVE
jgi:polyphosphate kinase 2 (PPK2 family)